MRRGLLLLRFPVHAIGNHDGNFEAVQVLGGVAYATPGFVTSQGTICKNRLRKLIVSSLGAVAGAIDGPEGAMGRTDIQQCTETGHQISRAYHDQAGVLRLPADQ